MKYRKIHADTNPYNPMHTNARKRDRHALSTVAASNSHKSIGKHTALHEGPQLPFHIDRQLEGVGTNPVQKRLKMFQKRMKWPSSARSPVMTLCPFPLSSL